MLYLPAIFGAAAVLLLGASVVVIGLVFPELVVFALFALSLLFATFMLLLADILQLVKHAIVRTSMRRVKSRGTFFIGPPGVIGCCGAYIGSKLRLVNDFSSDYSSFPNNCE